MSAITAHAAPASTPIELRCPECDYALIGLTRAVCPECGGASERRAHECADAQRVRRFVADSLWIAPAHVALLALLAAVGAQALGTVAFAWCGLGAVGASVAMGWGASARLPGEQRGAARALWVRTQALLHVPWLLAPVFLIGAGRAVEDASAAFGVLLALGATGVWVMSAALALRAWRAAWRIGVMDRSETGGGAGLPEALAACRACLLAAWMTTGLSVALGVFWFALPLLGATLG